MIGSPPAFLLPVFNFFHKNNKSEPMTNRQKVRIILFCQVFTKKMQADERSQ